MKPLISEQYWLIRTKQLWKTIIFIILISIAGLGFISSATGLSDNFGKIKIYFSLSAIAILAFAIIWLIQSIKCPKCGYKPVREIMKSSNISTWFTDVIKLKHCPSCKK